MQTGREVEFFGTTRRHENNQFSRAIHSLGADHIHIPPGCCKANADVGSIYAIIESAFYDIALFQSRGDFFFREGESYRLFHNLQRPDCSKKSKTPWLIAQAGSPRSRFGHYRTTHGGAGLGSSCKDQTGKFATTGGGSDFCFPNFLHKLKKE